MEKIRVGNPGDSPLEAADRNNLKLLKQENNGDVVIRANLHYLSSEFFNQDDAYVIRACNSDGDTRPEIFRLRTSYAAGDETDTLEEAAGKEGFKVISKDFLGLICVDEYGRKMRVSMMNGPWADWLGWADAL